jgi:hypothetical protein
MKEMNTGTTRIIWNSQMENFPYREARNILNATFEL